MPQPSHSKTLLSLVRTLLAVAIVSCVAVLARAQSKSPVQGSITGTVLDASEKTPLHGATVELKPNGTKTSSDRRGRFTFANLESGTYTLITTYVGYRRDTLTDVVVRDDRVTEITIRLHALPVEGPPIVVTGAVDPLPPDNGGGTVEISVEQIRTRPGAMGDISRVVAGMPTIARFDDRYASLVVRGGSPMENGYYIDNMPVPNISHFPSQGNAGGPLGLLNSTIIKDATFYSGGFSVAYGDRMSSVLDITLRDGDRTEFAGQADLAVSGAAVTAESPFAHGRGSWLLCGRHSFLSLLEEAVSLDATPNYDDLYTKVSRDLGANSSLSIIGLLGRGDFYVDRGVSYQSSVDFYGEMDYSTGTLGAAFNHTWPGAGTANVSLTSSYLGWTNDNYFTENNLSLYRNDSHENTVTLRNAYSRYLGERFLTRFGGEIRYLQADYNYTLADYANESGYHNEEVTVIRQPDYYAGGVWIEQDWRPNHRLTATFGVRGDIIGYASHSHLAPRGSVRYRPTEDLSLYAAAGVYYQSLPMVITLQHDSNEDLRDPRALHLVGGFGARLSSALRVNVEGYIKRYDHMPMDTLQPSVFILDELVYNYGFIAGHVPLVDNGRAQAYGCEITLFVRPSDQLLLRFGLGLSRARYRGTDNVWRARIIDNRVASDIEMAWKPDTRWGLSARWIFGGGRPYTPYDEPASKSLGGPVFAIERANTVRLPSYHSLTLRIERRIAIRGSDLTAYAELWNAYDRANVAGQYWDKDTDEVGRVHQFPRLPIIGLEYRF